MISADAWILRRGPRSEQPPPGQLERDVVSFSDLEPEEILVEPLYGCWEANMAHAIERSPIDVCRTRREEVVVLGNAGVVRVAKCGALISSVREGEICIVVPNGTTDKYGNTVSVFGYDARRSVGLLAKRTKLRQEQLVPIPRDTKYTLRQWAAFSLKYSSAWANWKVAYGALRLHTSESELPSPWVWAWGGGVSFAELTLARKLGCKVAMSASTDSRLDAIQHAGIHPIDRRRFPHLAYDAELFSRDDAARKRYLESEKAFMQIVREKTDDEGVNIFVDNIGGPVFRATLRALAPQGVLTTCGWKLGMDVSFRRAVECIMRRTHVHTHGARRAQGIAAFEFGESAGWVPPDERCACSFEDIGKLADEYAKGEVNTYFPLYEVNPS